MTSGRSMSIEQVLRWAYQTELCNLTSSDNEMEASGSHPMWKMRVDGTPHGWDAQAVARIVHPDALIVAKAVVGLRDGEWAQGRTWPPIVMAVERLSFSDQPFIDAAIPRAEMLIVCNARLGCRPQFDEDMACTPRRAPTGAPMVMRIADFEQETIDGGVVVSQHEIVAEKEKRRGPEWLKYPFGSYCLLQFWPTVENIMRDRADYVVWRAALETLRGRLSGELNRIAIGADLPEEFPWAA